MQQSAAMSKTNNTSQTSQMTRNSYEHNLLQRGSQNTVIGDNSDSDVCIHIDA